MAAERAALRQALNELVRLKGGADNPTRFLALLDRSALCEWAKRLGGISTSSTGSSTREGKLDAAAPRGPPGTTRSGDQAHAPAMWPKLSRACPFSSSVLLRMRYAGGQWIGRR